MSGKRIASVAGAIATAIAVIFAFQTALRVQSASANPHVTTAPAPAHKPALSHLERLPCFGCHNIEHYRKGKPKLHKPQGDDDVAETPEFSHTVHEKEGVGHCHVCHALEGHFHVTIRKETCAGCH